MKNSLLKYLAISLASFGLIIFIQTTQNNVYHAQTSEVTIVSLNQVSNTNSVELTYSLAKTENAKNLYLCNENGITNPSTNANCFNLNLATNSIYLQTGLHKITIDNFDLKLPYGAYNSNGDINLSLFGEYANNVLVNSELKTYEFNLVPRKTPYLNINNLSQVSKTTTVKLTYSFNKYEYSNAVLTYYMSDANGNWVIIKPQVVSDGNNLYHFTYNVGDYNYHYFKIMVNYPNESITKTLGTIMIKKTLPTITNFSSNEKIVNSKVITNIDGVVDLNDYAASEVKIQVYLDEVLVKNLENLPTTFNDKTATASTFGMHTLSLKVKDLSGNELAAQHIIVMLSLPPEIKSLKVSTSPNSFDIKIDYEVLLNDYPGAKVYFLVNDVYWSIAEFDKLATKIYEAPGYGTYNIELVIDYADGEMQEIATAVLINPNTNDNQNNNNQNNNNQNQNSNTTQLSTVEQVIKSIQDFFTILIDAFLNFLSNVQLFFTMIIESFMP